MLIYHKYYICIVHICIWEYYKHICTMASSSSIVVISVTKPASCVALLPLSSVFPSLSLSLSVPSSQNQESPSPSPSLGVKKKGQKRKNYSVQVAHKPKLIPV